MLKIDISFKHCDDIYNFKANIKKGIKHTFEIGERMLADKLFYVLCGLEGNIDYGIDLKNDILALGDASMFLKTPQKSIYKALRTRHKDAKQKTQEMLDLYKPEMQLEIALARAHFRDFKLLVVNCFQTYIKSADEYFAKRKNHLPKREDIYIIEIV